MTGGRAGENLSDEFRPAVCLGGQRQSDAIEFILTSRYFWKHMCRVNRCAAQGLARFLGRSEERRVGKECRSGFVGEQAREGESARGRGVRMALAVALAVAVGRDDGYAETWHE